MQSTIQELAQEAAGWFESAERETPDGREVFYRVKEGKLDWIAELVRDAHGDMLPDDWRYQCISSALDAIAEGYDVDDGPSEFADGYVDVYTSSLIAWLGSHGSRPGYCDDAIGELGWDEDRGIVGLMQLGQFAEAHEVFSSVVQSLEAELSARELDELGDRREGVS